MFSRRMLVAALSAMLILGAGVVPAAGRPVPTLPPVQVVPIDEVEPASERALTPAEQAISDAKIAEADAYVTGPGRPLLGLACVSPLAAGSEITDTAAPGIDATAGGCAIPSGFLVVAARNQERNHYCGPAVGQVISNYAWKAAATTNKYPQTTIAGWMKTDAMGQTSAPELASGLQKATVASPRHPVGFTWAVTPLTDLNRNGSSADELHNYIRTAVSHWKMPMAIAVKPNSPTSRYNLASWPNVVSTAGHWITAYGWYNFYVGNHAARIYYADSSENQGGGTGTYWNSTLSLAAMIGEHTGRFVW